MGKEQLKSKIEEQQAVYQALKAGNADTVRYKEFHNGEWGTDDEKRTACGGGQVQTRRQKPWMILMENGWSRNMKIFLQVSGGR